MEQAGALSDLRIPTHAGLAETIHIVVFPDNIVGADFNFFGPRLSRFSRYLKEKAPTTFQTSSSNPYCATTSADC